MKRALKIRFDAAIFCSQKYGGISRYFCELASRLSGFHDIDASIIAPVYINAYLSNLPRNSVIGFHLPDISIPHGPLRALSMLVGDGILRAEKPDVIHETYYSPRAIGPQCSKRVLTIYDMIHEKLALTINPADRTAKHKALAAHRADHIICISESTRRDAIQILDLPFDKTSVIHLGYDLMQSNNYRSETASVSVERPFLLFVGKRGGYKNFLGLLEAIGSSRELRSEYALTCFGGGKFNDEESNAIKAFGLVTDQVMQIDGNDKVLAELYGSATAFIYPSLYEGFGIPPLEAMSFDCPVVCSNTSSIPEVVGDAGEYFAPEDVESMRLAIERVVCSTDIQRNLKAKGRLRLSSFSWDRCAAETREIYKKLA